MNSSIELPWVKDKWPLLSVKSGNRGAGSQVSRLHAGCRTAHGMEMYPTPTELLPVWSTFYGCFLPLRAGLCIVSARSA